MGRKSCHLAVFLRVHPCGSKFMINTEQRSSTRRVVSRPSVGTPTLHGRGRVEKREKGRILLPPWFPPWLFRAQVTPRDHTRATKRDTLNTSAARMLAKHVCTASASLCMLLSSLTYLSVRKDRHPNLSTGHRHVRGKLRFPPSPPPPPPPPPVAPSNALRAHHIIASAGTRAAPPALSSPR